MREKVIHSAQALGLQVRFMRLEGLAATVEEAAGAVGCAPARIARSLVFVADGDPVLCITSGAHQVDLERLAGVLDVAEVRPATTGEVRAATGFPAGGVPPFGHGLPVVLDEDLLGQGRVWASGGDGHSVFEVAARELADCTEAIVATLGA